MMGTDELTVWQPLPSAYCLLCFIAQFFKLQVTQLIHLREGGDTSSLDVIGRSSIPSEASGSQRWVVWDSQRGCGVHSLHPYTPQGYDHQLENNFRIRPKSLLRATPLPGSPLGAAVSCWAR